METCSFQPVKIIVCLVRFFMGRKRDGFDRPLPVTFLDSLGKENDEIVNKNHVYMHIRYIYIYYCYYINVFVHPWSIIYFNLTLSLFQVWLRRELQRNYMYYIWIINNIKFTEDLRYFFVMYIGRLYYNIDSQFRDRYLKTICLKKQCYTFLTLLPSTQIFPLYDFTSTVNNSFKKFVTFVRSKFNSTYSYNLSVTWMYHVCIFFFYLTIL